MTKVIPLPVSVWVKRLRRADLHYYEHGTPLVTDAAYDKAKVELKKRAPNHPYFKEVGHAPTFGTKVNLPIKMGSLTKIRPGEIYSFVEACGKKAERFVVTPKLDGLAGLLHYRNGFLVAAYTRGDGIVGRVVTKNAKYLKGIPGADGKRAFFIPGNVYVKGEYCILNRLFSLFKGKDYKNPRNFVVGMMNRKELSPAVIKGLRHMMFAAYDVQIDRPFNYEKGKLIEFPTKTQRLNLLSRYFINVGRVVLPWSEKRKARWDLALKKQAKLKSWTWAPGIQERHDAYAKILAKLSKSAHAYVGGPTSWSTTKEHLKPSNLKKALEFFQKSLDILQDGLVIDVDDGLLAHNLGMESNGLNPVASKSIKLDVVDQTNQVGEIKEIQWNYTKRRVMKPVVVLKTPLDFNGVEVKNIYVDHAQFVKKKRIGIGSMLKIVRSGDVIPRVTATKANRLSADLPTKCPYCSTKLAWTLTKTDLFCPNKKCEGQEADRPVVFFTEIGVDKVGPGLFQQLVEAGYNTVPKILAADHKSWIKLDGWGPKRAQDSWTAIHNSLQGVPLAKVMAASNCFSTENASVGSTRLQNIVDAVGHKKIILGKLRRSHLEEIDGLADKSISIVLKGMPEFLKLWESISQYVKLKEKAPLKKGKMTGQVICFTGFRDKILATAIEEAGGQVTESWSSKVTALFAARESTKTARAKAKKIPIVPMTEAKQWVENRI